MMQTALGIWEASDEKANCIYKQRITSTNSNYEALWDAKQVTANYQQNHKQKSNDTITGSV